MNVTINQSALLSLDLGPFSTYVPPQYHHFFFAEPGVAPYRLLAYFSTLFNNQILTEIGVHNGWGSLALSYNERNTILGYDINLSTLNPRIPKERVNTRFYQGLAHKIDPLGLLSSSIIHLDAQHDGIYEQVVLDFLISRNYRGWLLMDDIHLNPEMEKLWNSITVPKHDITRYGHSTGTGLVTFNDPSYHHV